MSAIPLRSCVISVLVVRRTEDGGEFLLMRRAAATLHDTWCQVAGRIEENETAWQAALREVREETGLVPEALYGSDRIEHIYDAQNNWIELIPLFVAYVRKDAQVVLNHEHSEYRWVGAREASELLPFPLQRDNIRHVQEEFINRTPTELLRIHF